MKKDSLTIKSKYDPTYDLKVSFGITIAAGFLNIIFISTFLAHHVAFLLYTVSRRGIDTHLLDSPEAAFITSAYIVASLATTLLVALLARFKFFNLIKIAIIIQIVFLGVFIANVLSSVVAFYFSNSFLTNSVVVAVTLLTAFDVVKYLAKYSPSGNISKRELKK